MRTVTFFCLAALVAGPAWAAESGKIFDTPNRLEKLPLPKDPGNPTFAPNLTCAYYPKFMVKQVDRGEVGAERISVTQYRVDNRAQPVIPPCALAVDENEKLIPWEIWSGYFMGVKGDFIFLRNSDGINGGLPFAVFHASDRPRQIFQDIGNGFKNIDLITPTMDHSDKSNGTMIKLRYKRTYYSQCSILANQAACWAYIKQNTGLTQNATPDCKASYEKIGIHAPYTPEQLNGDIAVIDYDVEVVVGIDAAAIRVTPLPSEITCRPAD